MTRRFVQTAFMFCLALCLTTAAPVFAENLLDVVEAAQTTIQKKFPDRDSIARKMSLEELEKIARSGESDEQIIKAVLEKFPDTFSELAAKYDQNFNGIPDEWERKFNISAGFTAPESDEDADGFSLLQEYKAGTDPADPLSHPKYITQIFVSAVSRLRFSGLELVSVDTAPWNKRDWVASFNVIRNGRKRVEFVRIRDSFKHNDKVNFSVNDMEVDEKTKEPVVYIQRVGKVERIPCRPKQTVYDPSPRVRFLNALYNRTFTSSVGADFKLGTAKTGEELYRVVSADPETKEVIVETVSADTTVPGESFKILPAPKDVSASDAGKTAAGSSGTQSKDDSSPFLQRQ